MCGGGGGEGGGSGANSNDIKKACPSSSLLFLFHDLAALLTFDALLSSQ